LLKNPSFTVVAVLMLGLSIGVILPSTSGLSYRPLCLGIDQAQTCNLPSVNEVPIRPYPHDEEIDFRFRRKRQAFGMAYGQSFPIGEMHLEGAERSAVAHLSDGGDFHIRALNVPLPH
jgi:hypothetical protein